jgi:hypothetical protein
MMGIGVRAYARHRGVSHPAVSKAIKLGRITLLPDGTIDPELADKQWAGSVSRVNKPKADQVIAPKQKEAVRSQAQVVGDSHELHIPADATLTEIKAIHETVKARIALRTLMTAREGLADFRKVNKRLLELYQEFRDGWIIWVDETAKTMANEFGVDQAKIKSALEVKVREHFASMKDEDCLIKV